MTQIFNETRQSYSRLNEIVVDVLSATVIVLAGLVAVAQFAYY